MAFQKGYYYRDGKLAPSKATRRQKKRDAEIRKISEVWYATKHLYDYDNPPLTKYIAEQKGWDIYWSICKYGHVGERSVKNSSCKTCEKINRSIRNARTRGALTIALSREEKNQIAALYQKAQALSVKTGKQHHVDHIRPLAAGGLHHPDNLRVISAEENLAKGALYKGKRRKYSRREKKEARERFKQGFGRYSYNNSSATYDIFSGLLTGCFAGLCLGPLGYLYSSMQQTGGYGRNRNRKVGSSRKEKYVNLGITVACLFWLLMIVK